MTIKPLVFKGNKSVFQVGRDIVWGYIVVAYIVHFVAIYVVENRQVFCHRQKVFINLKTVRPKTESNK